VTYRNLGVSAMSRRGGGKGGRFIKKVVGSEKDKKWESGVSDGSRVETRKSLR